MINKNYTCPNVLRRNDMNFIMCKALAKKPIGEYTTLKDCEKILCGHQYFCNRVNRWENTEQARRCPYNK